MPRAVIDRLIVRHTPTDKVRNPVPRRTHAKISTKEAERVERNVWKDGRVDGDECVGLMELLSIFGPKNQTGEPHHFADVEDARRMKRTVLGVLSSQAKLASLPRDEQKVILSEGMQYAESAGFKLEERHTSERSGLRGLRVPARLRPRVLELFAEGKREAEAETGARFRSFSINMTSMKRGRQTYGHQIDIYFDAPRSRRAYSVHFVVDGAGAILEKTSGAPQIGD